MRDRRKIQFLRDVRCSVGLVVAGFVKYFQDPSYLWRLYECTQNALSSITWLRALLQTWRQWLHDVVNLFVFVLPAVSNFF